MPLTHMLLAVAIAATWGLSFVAIKIGVAATPPLLLTALRFTFAALPMVFILKRPRVPWPMLAAYGVSLGAMQFGFLFVAIKLGMPAGLASLVMQLQVFFTIALAALGGEKPKPLQVVGCIVAFVGVGAIAAGQPSAQLVAFGFVVAGAASWAVGNVISRSAGRRAVRVDMLAFVCWASLFAPPPLLLLSAITEGEAAWQALIHPSLTTVLSTAYLSYAATVFGFGSWAWLLARYRAATVTPFALLVPIFGFLSGHLLLGEPVDLSIAVGALLVFAGLAANIVSARRVPVPAA